MPLKKAGPRISRLLPFPRREDALVHGQPGQAVLPLLRLRRARHRARLPDGRTTTWHSSKRSRNSRSASASRCRAKAARPEPVRGDDDLYVAARRRPRCSSGASSRATQRVQEYAATRGLTPRVARAFRDRLCPERRGTTAAQVRRHRRAQLAAARSRPHHRAAERGEQRRPGAAHYDRFRDRVMFPIRDARGRVLAFGGRVLDQGEPKYLNSPETPLFHKGRELYGLYEVRQSARRRYAADDRRGLHGRRAAAPGRHHVRRRDARHRDDARTPQARCSASPARSCSASTAIVPAARPPGER